MPLRTLASRYGLAAGWALMPFTAGPALAAALEGAGQTFRTGASVALWAIWAMTLLAALVPRPATLTAVRIAMPALPVAGVWATIATPAPGWRDVLCLATGIAVAAAALWAGTGERFIDGASYGTERRFGLRPPGVLLAGPVELAWAATVAGGLLGPALLLAGTWWLGIAATVVGWPVAALATRSLHSLSQRCVVFVPAGLVVVDPSSLAEPALVVRQAVTRIGMARSGTRALDIGAGALGTAMEVELSDEQSVALAPRRGERPEIVEARSLMLSPSRPGALIAEAASRAFAVG